MPMSPNQVRIIDPVLTTVALGFQVPEFIGDILSPRVSVSISGGQVIQFGKEHFQSYNLKRAPGSAFNRLSLGYSGVPFALKQDAISVPVPRENLRDAAVMPGVDLGSRATRLGMRVILQSLEVERAALYLNASNYGGSNKVALTGAGKWSDPTSNPVTQIEGYKEQIRSQCGMYPNVLALSAVAFKALRTNPQVVARFQYTSAGSITTDMLAGLFDIEKVVVGRAIQADDAGVFTDIWGNNAILGYVALGSVEQEAPSGAYTYVMDGHPLVEEAWFDQNTKSWIYDASMERVPVMPAPGAMYLVQNPN